MKLKRASGWCGLAALATLLWAQAAAAQTSDEPRGESVPTAPDPEQAREAFRKNVVTIKTQRIGGYTVGPTATMPGGGYVLPTDLWEGYRGDSKEKLGLLEFYDAVDRPDLKSKALTHTIVQLSFGVAGVGLAVGGGVVVGTHWDDEGGPPTVGWVLIGSGIACLVTAYILGPSILRADEAALLAKKHNQRLRLKLGLPDAPPRRPSSNAARSSARPQSRCVTLRG